MMEDNTFIIPSIKHFNLLTLGFNCFAMWVFLCTVCYCLVQEFLTSVRQYNPEKDKIDGWK